ncbi:MAG: phosphatase PAP2 family protein [Lysobacter sp.]
MGDKDDAAPIPRALSQTGIPHFYRNHLLLPGIAAICLSAVLMGLDGDFLLADRLYAMQGHAWALKVHWITEGLIHQRGKSLSAAVWLLVLAAWAWSAWDARLARWRRPLAYLAITTLLACLAVSVLKAVSGMDCPWDLQRYGGSQTFVGLLQLRPPQMPSAACFPAGHASAGYGWVTLYFFLLAVRPRWRWAGLAIALVAGGVFGFSQQLRGAHFLSHDLWSLMTCWLVALAGYVLMFRTAR